MVKFVSDRYPCQWPGAFDTSWYSKGISVTDELYYIMTYRTHLIIGRDICHWRTLLYHDVSNASEHWQWYLSLANFTISRRIERTWSLAGISVKFVSDRYPCQWSGVFDTSWYSKVRQWQISLPSIERIWSLAVISVTGELYYIKTYRTHLVIGRDICHWQTLLYHDYRTHLIIDLCQWSGVFDTSCYSKIRQRQISLSMIRCVRYVLI
jgi:hypothetical protein